MESKKKKTMIKIRQGYLWNFLVANQPTIPSQKIKGLGDVYSLF